MVNEKGLASYCQECGACAARTDGTSRDLDVRFIDRIVDEVVQTIRREESGTPARPDQTPPIPLGVSNHHIHLSEAILSQLFGTGTSLEVYRPLYQPGDFAAKQTVTIVGSKMRAIQNVRILGPLRSYNQVEISVTDAIHLGITPPVRDSGNLDGAAPLTLVGPAGSVYLPACAIIASRHIHMTDGDAATFGVKNGDLSRVRIGGIKPTVFENVRVRTSNQWKLQLHLDTDEANATGTLCGSQAEFLGKM